MNRLGAQGAPFLFIIDFDRQKPLLFPLNELPGGVFFKTPAMDNSPLDVNRFTKEIKFRKKPVSLAHYRNAFDKVQYHLNRGDTYLLNLTLPTEIEANLSLQEIYEYSHAPYKLLVNNRFVCFSPEIFVRINNGKIASYPMKGTIDASLPDAEWQILNNPKELAEHNTIVDLIRNDLSIVAKKVKVRRYRYIDRVETHERVLLQVSSEIEGVLEEDYPSRIGDILYKLLPAGSVSGAPKKKTTEIIKAAENYHRGYYTGIFGVFDGHNLDSAVMIRFIEQQGDNLIYKSGGGITAQSELESEYNELIAKVYLPLKQK